MRLAFLTILAGSCLLISSCHAGAVPPPAPVDEYRIHADGGLVYDPLRREAEKTGQLKRYADAVRKTGDIRLGKYRLRYSLPVFLRAYDVVPVRYKLTWGDGAAFPVAVEATAFEDDSRRGGRDLYDLALPGKLSLDVQYLGSVTAHLKPGARHIMKPDLSDEPARSYPNYVLRPMTRSGVVEAGDIVWFKFRYTNTGDTILDPDGFGGWLAQPELWRNNGKGKYEFLGHTYNLYVRDLKYLYPGESHEVWVNFCAGNDNSTPENRGLVPGKYKIRFRSLYRNERDFDWLKNMWGGTDMHVCEFLFGVEPQTRQAPVDPCRVTLTDGGGTDKITRWVHTLQEFMTAFDVHQSKPRESKSIEGTLYLQVAPWTKQIVVKLISTGPVKIRTATVRVKTDSGSLSMKYCSSSTNNIIINGIRQPLVMSQTMADMRANIQLGPHPECYIRDDIRLMKKCGINAVCTTCMPWLYSSGPLPQESSYNGDAMKYTLDVARREGLFVEGWGNYPFARISVGKIASWIGGNDIMLESAFPVEASLADPNLTIANAIVWLYQFHRWGNLFYQLENGDVPFSAEDTRGWLRQDINIRYPMGERVIGEFRKWAREKYATIDAANAAWGSSYLSFDEVDPEVGQIRNQFGHEFEYTNSAHPFHDWNQAVLDLDEFRTELRVRNYRDTLALVRKEIPGATIALRTEGGNAVVSGIDPESRNPHFRHIFYSQRRCAAIAEILQKSGVVKYHSDYTTIPYTPSEVRELTRAGVTQGIVPMWLPQFNHMRDIAVNAKYGTDYQTHYNLSEPRKGAMMHVLTAAYPWLSSAYEEGGVPGLLWGDYLCDGFVTETQVKEMNFFRSKLAAALSTPEAQKQRSAKVRVLSQEWRNGAKRKLSYRPAEMQRHRARCNGNKED